MHCPCAQFDLQKYKNKPYQQTPCAKCSLVKQASHVNKHIQLLDTDGAIQDIQNIVQQQIDQDQYVPQDIPVNVINAIAKACQQNLLITLSNTILKLSVLAKQYPALFQVLMLKMQHPQLSYYQIGQSMVPPCSKQNVLYHLQHAVQKFPQLAKAIITDTRFSGGKNAIKKVLDKTQKFNQTSRIKHLLYSQSQANTAKSVQQLQQIFKKPYKADSIMYFQSMEVS